MDETDPSDIDNKQIVLRNPRFEDGLKIFKLIQAGPPLDLNSVYYYYILCRDFSETCVVAEMQDTIVGFISAYCRPGEPSCLFVWQVAVAPLMRGRHLATDMLEWLFSQPDCEDVTVLETTVTPSNKASEKLFRRFAESHKATCETATFLETAQLGQEGHEAEILFRIRPLR